MAAYRPDKAEGSRLILLVSYSGALGGAERVLLDVAGSLPAEACVACPPGPLARACERAGVRVLTLAPRSLRLRGGMVARTRAIASLAGHGRELARLQRDLRPDATVLWGMRSALAWLLVRSALDKAGGRVVLAHHDMLPAGAGIGAAVRAAAARADAVVVNSRAVADDLDPGGVLRARLSVVYPGVSLPPEVAPWPARPPLVVVIGALVGWKRVELALEAVAVARRSVPSLRLRVVGAALDPGDGVEQRLRARAAEPDLAGRVEFTGAVDNAAGEAADAICLLHCAEREPFGLVVAEALACGRPVVVPAVGGAAEIVDASCAITYPPGDAGAAATALVALARDPERARAMGAAGRARVAQRFGRAAMREGFARAITPGVRTLGTKRSNSERLMPSPARDRGTASDFALVTVSFNSAAVLPAMLDSVALHLPGVRVIVVDCGSSDDSAAIARAHPVAVAVDAGANLGFGRGSNLGLTHVTEPVTVFVNPDVELIDGSLRALASELLAPSGAPRLLAPLVLSGDGSRQDTVHPAPGSAAELARLLLPPARVPGALGSALAPWRAQRPRPVGWAVGCVLAGRTETLRALGPFSEEIFMYGEDLELGLRATQEGIDTWFWPRARVVHHRAHATAAAYEGEPFALLAAARSRAIAMTLGAQAARRDERAQAALFGSRALVKRALGRDRSRELAQLRAVRSLRG
ncbi:MAG TPA: glycosyltransferase [Solirubrobacteraceae bacterium]|nr:glycosyltransferase [Solirubrobacteraceae bacterium]